MPPIKPARHLWFPSNDIACLQIHVQFEAAIRHILLQCIIFYFFIYFFAPRLPLNVQQRLTVSCGKRFS